MRSTEGRAVGFNTFYCDECGEEHPKYIATEHPHYSRQVMKDYKKEIAPLAECEHGVRFDPRTTKSRHVCGTCRDNQAAHF